MFHVDPYKNTISDIGMGQVCPSCGIAHIEALNHPDSCPDEPKWDYPYSNRCGQCHERTVLAQVCMNCGADYRMVKCQFCGIYYAAVWDSDGGCPECREETTLRPTVKGGESEK